MIETLIGKIVGIAMGYGITIDGWHPMLAHFALALPVVAALFWLFGGAKNPSFKSAASTLFFLGLIAIFATFITGRAIGTDAAIILSPDGKEIFEQHVTLGNALTLFYLLLALLVPIVLFLKKKPLAYFVAILMFVGAIALLYQARIGEILVYTYGAGISTSQ
ncbi:MAG: hypothetical protein B6D59_01045 [Campylobacteraceae bacterium 4484_4]|nr:MAG: hypothetical protein B6D59_01045 [Campylobacteraceae bacterium 4484_4]